VILVTGSTGTVGRHVVTELAALETPVRALGRDPDSVPFPRDEPIAVAQGDLGDPETPTVAMTGVQGVFVLLPPGSRMTEFTENIVTAARECEVQHLVEFD
jgi:uncharacterized protein YbjT (DUF2867 family)